MLTAAYPILHLLSSIDTTSEHLFDWPLLDNNCLFPLLWAQFSPTGNTLRAFPWLKWFVEENQCCLLAKYGLDILFRRCCSPMCFWKPYPSPTSFYRYMISQVHSWIQRNNLHKTSLSWTPTTLDVAIELAVSPRSSLKCFPLISRYRFLSSLRKTLCYLPFTQDC